MTEIHLKPRRRGSLCYRHRAPLRTPVLHEHLPRLLRSLAAQVSRREHSDSDAPRKTETLDAPHQTYRFTMEERVALSWARDLVRHATESTGEGLNGA